MGSIYTRLTIMTSLQHCASHLIGNNCFQNCVLNLLCYCDDSNFDPLICYERLSGYGTDFRPRTINMSVWVYTGFMVELFPGTGCALPLGLLLKSGTWKARKWLKNSDLRLYLNL